jgi:hypothetical protein
MCTQRIQVSRVFRYLASLTYYFDGNCRKLEVKKLREVVEELSLDCLPRRQTPPHSRLIGQEGGTTTILHIKQEHHSIERTNLCGHQISIVWYQIYMLAEHKSSRSSRSPLQPQPLHLLPSPHPLKILLPPNKPISPPPPLRIHITLNMQLTAQPLWPTEENTTLAGAMNLPNRSEDHIPIRPAKVRRCFESCDGVGVAAVEDDV